MLREIIEESAAPIEAPATITVAVRVQHIGLSTSPRHTLAEDVFLPEDVSPTLFTLLRRLLADHFGEDLAERVPIQRSSRPGSLGPGWEATETEFVAVCRQLFAKSLLVDYAVTPPG